MSYAVAHGSHGRLDGDGVDLAEQQLDQRIQILLHLGGACHITGEELVHDLHHLPGGNVGGNGDTAHAADGQQGQGDAVLAGVDVQLVAAEGSHFHGLGHVAGGLLDGADVGMVSQDGTGLGRQVAAGAAGDVVHDDGLGGVVRDPLIVLDQAVLGGLVVVGSHHQDGIGAVVTGGLGEVQHMLGVVGAGTGHHGDTACGALDGEADDLLALGGGQGGALAGGAHGNQSGNAVLDLEVDEPCQIVIVHAGGGHGRDQGSTDALEDGLVGLGHVIFLPFFSVKWNFLP